MPQRKAASSTWCAFGAAAADVLHIFEHSEIMPTPVPAKRVNDALDDLEKKALALMKSEGIAPKRQRFEFSLDVRHRGQINEVEVPLSSNRVGASYEPELRKNFVERYEKLYGRGSALAGAQLEIVVALRGARADAAAEARGLEKGNQGRSPPPSASALDLLARPAQVPTHAGLRRREARDR